MASTPRFKVYTPSGEYVAACKYAEDAAFVCGSYGDGATIRDGHARVVWRDGEAHDGEASESADHVRNVIWERLGLVPA
jgi:hypothetical protein